MTETLPALPTGTDARLPDTYESAQRAIAQCDRIDECKSWADKSAALASYARQARDDTMRLMALRIQQRATRRMGELLKQIPRGDADGVNLRQHRRDGAVPPVTRTQAANEAGLSERQRKTALRLANVPETEFVAAIHSERPPTITELAMRGTAIRPPEPEPPPADPAEADETQSALWAFAEFCKTHDAHSIAKAIPATDAVELRKHVQLIDGWLDRFVTHLSA
ncbi:MAG TPA: hypothetical protein VN660_02030 [Steroidobacteraceae bacterium]|nr:hypothetical protein [Steroidobacteraceae bacterium]